MKKKVVLAMCIAFFILLTGCSNAQRNTALEEAAYSVIEDKDNKEFSLSELTAFDWDEAHLFSPYISRSDMEEQLGVKYRDKSNIVMRDDIFLLVFIKDDKVVHYAEIEHQGSVLSTGEEDYLTPSHDVIYIERYND